MAESQTPDICVIGGGASGLAVAHRARALGARVMLVEAGALGGAALHGATIPSKALAAAGRRAHCLRTAASFGIANAEPKISARGVFDHIHEIVGGFAPAINPEQLRAAGIELVQGRAKFLDRRTIVAGDRQIRARRFVIATGSRLPAPEIPGLRDVPYFTSATVFENTRKLTHLVVIGGGAVALEMAQSFRRLGSEVTVVSPGSLLADFDPELAAIVLGQLAAEGVALRPMTEVAEVRQRSLGIGVAIRSAAGEETLDASHILVATDRLPNVDGLELDRAGIRRRDADATRLELRGDLRTSNPRVYAVGDAAMVASYPIPSALEAETVLRSALLRLPGRLDTALVPRAGFTDPEIAEVGVSEQQTSNRNSGALRVLRLSFAESDRAFIERQPYGLAKVVVGPGDRLLGAGIAGTGAAEMISLFGFAIANGMSLGHFRKFAAPYPTLAGIAGQLAEAASSKPIAAPLGWLLAVGRVLP